MKIYICIIFFFLNFSINSVLANQCVDNMIQVIEDIKFEGDYKKYLSAHSLFIEREEIQTLFKNINTFNNRTDSTSIDIFCKHNIGFMTGIALIKESPMYYVITFITENNKWKLHLMSLSFDKEKFKEYTKAQE